MLITEGLAELKVIDKRIEKSRQFVVNNIARHSMVKDPLAKDGGSIEVLKRELQSIADLEQRKMLIRTAIQRTNLSTTATIKGQTRSIAEWLTFRREVAAGRSSFYGVVTASIGNIRKQARDKGGALAKDESSAGESDILLNLDELAWHEASQSHEEIVGTLDGVLSVINATTNIDGV